MDFGSNIFLAKYLKEYKNEHPLLKLFHLNPNYTVYFNGLLEELGTAPNLQSKIKQMKDPLNWESTVSELEFAMELKKRGLCPEFVKQKKDSPSTDIKIDLLGKEIYFEAKLLVDEATRVYKEIWAIESDFLVKISCGVLIDKNKADRLIRFVKDKIDRLQIGSFEMDNCIIQILKKNTVESPQTSLIMGTKDFIEIPLEQLRKKLFKDFKDKLPQFSSEKIVFWFIDGKRWYFKKDAFRSVVYGTIHRDLVVPSFSYPKKDGLFFLNDAKCLKGILFRSYNSISFFLNPFAEPRLDIDVLKKLKQIFPI